MLWYRHRQVPGRQDAKLVADSRGTHVSKEPRHGKDGPLLIFVTRCIKSGMFTGTALLGRARRFWPKVISQNHLLCSTKSNFRVTREPRNFRYGIS